MGLHFNALTDEEQAAITAYVNAEYDKLVFQYPTYLSKNAQADPDGWRATMSELIAADTERVREIVERAGNAVGGPSGFTLIEMSLVLVIIGLIVGGVLVGQSLVSAAAVRAQITQIERYNTAVNTFRSKYDALPGDIADPGASSFGFLPRGQYAGEGDGNGVIEGVTLDAVAHNYGCAMGEGETILFWVDLSTAQLIDGGFTVSSYAQGPWSGGALNLYYPTAKLGGGNYIYAWSGGIRNGTVSGNGINYYGLSALTTITGGYIAHSNPGLTVSQAKNIDTKIDDGLPQSGNVTAFYLNTFSGVSGASWAAAVGSYGASTGFQGSGNPTTAATPGSAATCYDNGGVGGATQQYSVEQNGGSGVNCALSLQFQ